MPINLDDLSAEMLGLNPLQGKLMTSYEITSMEPTKDLIDGVLSERSLAVLYGKYGSGKSFVALDWALCVANGFPWQSRVVRGGPVLYILAEGSGGMRDRVLAWYRGTQPPKDDAHFLPQPVNLLKEKEVDYATKLVQDLGVKLVVIDTLNQSLVGGDENSSVHMGTAVRSAKTLQESSDATVLIVHHTGHNGELRGHSSLPAAADHIIRAWTPDDDDSNLVILYSKKVKEGPRFDPIKLRLQRQAVPGSRDGSCVVVAA